MKWSNISTNCKSSLIINKIRTMPTYILHFKSWLQILWGSNNATHWHWYNLTSWAKCHRHIWFHCNREGENEINGRIPNSSYLQHCFLYKAILKISTDKLTHTWMLPATRFVIFCDRAYHSRRGALKWFYSSFCEKCNTCCGLWENVFTNWRINC